MITRRTALKGLAAATATSLPFLHSVAWAGATDEWEMVYLGDDDLDSIQIPDDFCESPYLKVEGRRKNRPTYPWWISSCIWPDGPPQHPRMHLYMTEDLDLNKRKLDEWVAYNEYAAVQKTQFYHAKRKLHGFSILGKHSEYKEILFQLFPPIDIMAIDESYSGVYVKKTERAQELEYKEWKRKRGRI